MDQKLDIKFNAQMYDSADRVPKPKLNIVVKLTTPRYNFLVIEDKIL